MFAIKFSLFEVGPLFTAFSEGASLNPDEEDDGINLYGIKLHFNILFVEEESAMFTAESFGVTHDDDDFEARQVCAAKHPSMHFGVHLILPSPPCLRTGSSAQPP